MNTGGIVGGAMGDRIGRSVLRDVAAQSDRTSQESSAVGAAFLGQTTSDGDYPTAARATFAVVPVEIDAEDTEGAPATFAPDTEQTCYAVNLGGSIPPQGSLVVVTSAGGRYVFRYD